MNKNVLRNTEERVAVAAQQAHSLLEQSRSYRNGKKRERSSDSSGSKKYDKRTSPRTSTRGNASPTHHPMVLTTVPALTDNVEVLQRQSYW